MAGVLVLFLRVPLIICSVAFSWYQERPDQPQSKKPTGRKLEKTGYIGWRGYYIGNAASFLDHV
jgi:hypothetical protein